MSRRVVITGLGLCTPIGCGVDAFWSNLLAGRSGIGPVTLFDASALSTRIAGEVKEFSGRGPRPGRASRPGEPNVGPLSLLGGSPGRLALPEPLPADVPLDSPALRTPDRKVWLGWEAALQAIADAGLAQPSALRTPHSAFEEALLSVGVCLEVFFIEQVAPVIHAADPALALARQVLSQPDNCQLQIPLDQLTQFLGGRYGFARGRYTNCSACAAGAQAIGEAFRRLRAGQADLALAGATDSTLTPLGLGGFSLLRILSTENDTPQRACRPFDATRQGTVLSEGAAFLVLETLDHALARGARIYAEIAGYGSSLDAFRATDPAPNGRGAALSMAKAIADASLAPAQIDGVNAHGTGTPKNDLAETLAIKQVLGPRACQIPVTANKSMTGHMIAASGAVEAVASVLTLARGQVPPTINLEHPDPECDLDYVPGRCREFAGRTVLSNSFGFGGQNATLIFARA